MGMASAIGPALIAIAPVPVLARVVGEARFQQRLRQDSAHPLRRVGKAGRVQRKAGRIERIVGTGVIQEIAPALTRDLDMVSGAAK